MLGRITRFFSSSEPTVIPPAEREYLRLVATTACLVDGQVSNEERQLLATLEGGDGAPVLAIGADGQPSRPVTFDNIEKRHKAIVWDKEKQERLLADLARFIASDKEVSAEEEAFAIQMAQIFHGGERVDLYVCVAGMQTAVSAPFHDFFTYIDRASAAASHPNTRVTISPGRVYTDHPFLMGALIPFSDHGLQQAQLTTMQGTVALMRDLGARELRIHCSRELSAALGADYETSIAGSVPKVGKIKADTQIEAKASRTSCDESDIVVRFEGRTPLLRRFFPGYWNRRLRGRYARCELHLNMIEHRMADNRVHEFRYEISSRQAASLDIALDNSQQIGEMLNTRTGLRANASQARALREIVEVKF